MSKLRFFIAAVFAIIIVSFLLDDSDEDRIKSKFKEMAETVPVSESEERLETLAIAKQLSEHFTEESIFDLTHLGYRSYEFSSRRELAQQILVGRSRLASLEANVDVEGVSISRNRATAAVQASGLATIKGEQDQFLEIHKFQVALVEKEGDWIIEKVTHVRNMRDPEDVG